MPKKTQSRQPAITGIETGPMSLPKMDRPSVAFAWFLDSMIVEWSDQHDALMLTCAHCGTDLCEVEHSDTLRVLLNTALAHDCTSHP
jgi:hypothetical protein